MKALALAVAALAVLGGSAAACETPVSVCSTARPGAFMLIHAGKPAAVLAEASADPAVRRVAASFAGDLERVGGGAAARPTDPAKARGDVVVIGVVGQSPVIDGLARSGKLRL